MVLQNSKFEEMELPKEQVIVFPHGIPGFKERKSFVIVSVENSPFSYLQSTEIEQLSFIMVSPFDFFPDYEFDLSEQAVDELKIKEDHPLRIYSIVSVRGELASATVNMVAPVIINDETQLGMQYILPDGTYSIHQPLFSQALLRKGG